MLLRSLILLPAFAALSGCAFDAPSPPGEDIKTREPEITKAKYDRIQTGMTRKAVETILNGRPGKGISTGFTREDGKAEIVGPDRYLWIEGEVRITVDFADGKVIGKNCTAWDNVKATAPTR